jgi:hypothetical protein
MQGIVHCIIDVEATSVVPLLRRVETRPCSLSKLDRQGMIDLIGRLNLRLLFPCLIILFRVFDSYLLPSESIGCVEIHCSWT